MRHGYDTKNRWALQKYNLLKITIEHKSRRKSAFYISEDKDGEYVQQVLLSVCFYNNDFGNTSFILAPVTFCCENTGQTRYEGLFIQTAK